MLKLTLDFQNTTETKISVHHLTHHLERTLRRLGQVGKVIVEIKIVEDRTIQQLNHQYLGHNQPTDVLSFPNSLSAGETPILGSLVISAPTARTQAHQAGTTVQQEIETLAGHGLLHLLGYHHR